MNRLQYVRRRGSMYVAVLGSAMVITVTGLSALMLARSERSSAAGTADLSTARFYAQSAIELGQHRIRQDSNWRQTSTSGAWESNRPIGTGKYTLEGIDPVDGNLGNSASDSVLLRGTGFEGLSRYKLEVTMNAKSRALTCLQVAMHTGLGLIFNSATVQSNLMTISSNGTALAISSLVYPNVEVVTTWSGSNYQTLPKSGITPRTMPDATVFDYYTTNGTTINYASIPKVSGKTTIEKCVLSPSINNYGSTNPNGIYVINCGLGALVIRNCRIVGTLVIITSGAFSIENSVIWDPAVTNYPSLLVNGSAAFKYTNTALSESSTNVNFNPSGPPAVPYQGASDTDKVDNYPSVINGLVYVSGSATTATYVTINGVLVVGTTLTAQNTLSLSYQSTFYDNPPPGFGSAAEMEISPGTWKQLVD